MDSRELVVRQQRLLLRSAQLRLTLAEQVQIFKQPLALADRAQDGWRRFARNPLWPLGALLVLVVLKPRRIISLGGRVWWAWTTFKRIQSRLE